MINDFCRMFKEIEEDPSAMVYLTVGEYLKARQHVKSCEDCSAIVDMVLERANQGNEAPFTEN